MQTLHLSDEQFEKLTAAAKAAGYADVPAFITAITEEPSVDPRGSLSEQERAESVAMIQRGQAEIEAGGGMDAEAAFSKICDKHGLKLSQ
ncbi:MAG: hypothetical protein AAGF31_07185 [Planctomycetota bacterium]